MGQLFNRIRAVQANPRPPIIVIPNNTTAAKPTATKRKRLEHEYVPRKRKVFTNEDGTRILTSVNFVNRTTMNHSYSSRISFRCQLCCQCFTAKDAYLDHMIHCAIERQASIRIVRAKAK